MQLRQYLKLQQKLSQELKLQIKQQMLLQLKLTLKEWSNYITFEDDDDVSLLEKSFPFLILHELSHPLEAKGYVNIPNSQFSEDTVKSLTAKKLDRSTYAQCLEVGIDKSAMVIGKASGKYSENEIIYSAVATFERIFRNVFRRKENDFDFGLTARIDAELRTYDQMDNRGVTKDICKLRYELDNELPVLLPGMEDLYNTVVKEYQKIYDGTSVQYNKARSSEYFKDKSGFFIH